MVDAVDRDGTNNNNINEWCLTSEPNAAIHSDIVEQANQIRQL